MNDRFIRTLLRRIALGLPVVVGPIVLAGGLAGCGGQQCTPGARMTSSHAATAEVIAMIGMGASFMPSECAALCLQLDGVQGPDAGVSDSGSADAGAQSIDPSFALRATITCAFESSDILSCTYQGQTVCTGSSCVIPPCAIAGRLPDALVASRPHGARDLVSAWLASTAHLEAAAVPAFEDLAEELALHGAPRGLSLAARRSADDERRHARVVGALARRVGIAPPPVERRAREPRELFAVALDNAMEGTVREAHAALIAAHQGEHARSAEVRRAIEFYVGLFRSGLAPLR